MKPYLVDVPVSVQIWIRPECQRRQFEVIKQARPSTLLITSDGGRTEDEWKAILQNRKMYDEEIDWDCTVHKLYFKENHGAYGIGLKKLPFIWEKVDRCIFLEDDHIPSVSMFKFCEELLERYKDDERIEMITTQNVFGVSENVNSDYFFVRDGSIWCFATWKRTYLERNDFSYYQDPYIMSLLKEQTKGNKFLYKRLVGYGKSRVYDGHIAGTEFYKSLGSCSKHRLQIVPKYNLLSNIGATAGTSAHADALSDLPRGVRCLFGQKTYELEFPLKHPKYFIPDNFYQKKYERLIAVNHPIVGLYRKLERGFRKLLKGDVGYIVKKIKKRNPKNGKITEN